MVDDKLAADKPVLMVLGSAHLANPGRDYVNLTVDDVLQPKLQRAIADLVSRLARFQPTKIAVEVPLEEESRLNEDYTRYIEGRFDLSRSEEHQIGFRLGKSLGHAKLYAIDSWVDPPPGLDVDFESFAREHGQQNLIEEALRAAREDHPTEERILAEGSLVDLYRAMNRPDKLLADHRVYFTLARIGSGLRYPGANWVKGGTDGTSRSGSTSPGSLSPPIGSS